METILKINYSNGESTYVTKVQNKSFSQTVALRTFFTANECSAITSGYSMVKHILDSTGQEATIEEIDQHLAFIESMRKNPLVRVIDENSETSKRTGLKPWHHVNIYGNKAYGVIWDTREIDVVAKIDDIDFSELEIVKTDSGADPWYNDERFSNLALSEFAVGVPAEITDEQFEQIRWS